MARPPISSSRSRAAGLRAPIGFLQRFVSGTAMPRVRPFQEMGSSSTPIFGGYIVSLERNPEWVGISKYKSAAEIATNVSIVAAGVHYFLNLIARPTWNVVPVDDANAEAVKLAEFVEDVLYGMNTPWSRVVRRAGMYHFYGFAIQEWTAVKRKDGKIGFKDVEQRSQYSIEQWVVNENGYIDGVWQRSPQTNALLAIPRSKCLYLVEDTLSDSPEGVGVFRHMAEPWNRLKKFLELETMAFERDLRGTPVGRAPLTAIREAVQAGKVTEAEGSSLIDGMKQFVQLQVKSQNTGMLLDSVPYTSVSTDGPKVSGLYQWGMELLQGSANGLQELRQAIDRVQREMARIIGVEGLMLGDSPSGSRALSEDKSKALYLIANAVLNNMAEQATKDLIDPLWVLNGFDDELKPYLQPEDVTFKDVDQISAVLRDMATAGAVLDPRDPVVDDVRDLLGVSRPDPTLAALDASAQPTKPDHVEMQQEAAGVAGKKPGGKEPPNRKPGTVVRERIKERVTETNKFGKENEYETEYEGEGAWYEEGAEEQNTGAAASRAAARGNGTDTGHAGSTGYGARTGTSVGKEGEGAGEGQGEIEKYDPSQPRDPAGTSTGGRWTRAGASTQFVAPEESTDQGVVSAQALLDRFTLRLEVEAFEAGLPQEVQDKIAWAEGELAKYKSTSGLVSEGGFKNPDGTWTEQRRALHDKILADFFNENDVARATPKPGEAPEFIMLGGRPGAGKSTALNSGVFIGLDPDNYLTINADEFQTHLPGYRGELAGHYSPEGQYLAERAEMLARKSGLNVIYDATMKSTAPALQRAKDLKSEGYKISSYFVHVAPQESARRAMEKRFMHPGGRYVPSKILLGALTNETTFDTVRPIVDRWALFDGNTPQPHLVGIGGH